MNKYQIDVSLCIEHKLFEYILNKDKSIIDIYNCYTKQIETIKESYIDYINHYTKIMALAYQNTLELNK